MATAGLLVLALAVRDQMAWAALACQGVLVVCSALALLHEELGDPSVRSVRRQIRVERRVGAALRDLEAVGWQILHDRLLADSRIRLAHLAIGPAGVVIVKPALEHEVADSVASAEREVSLLDEALRRHPDARPYHVGFALVHGRGSRSVGRRLTALPSVLPPNAEVLLVDVLDELCPRAPGRTKVPNVLTSRWAGVPRSAVGGHVGPSNRNL